MAVITGVSEVIRSMEKWAATKTRELETVSNTQIVPLIENYAKTNRPWTDRTGDARRGLTGKIVVSATEIAIQLHHSVFYGVYLELSRAGKYAILVPTLNAKKQEIKDILQGVIDR